MKKPRVLMAMSGGIDSSVAAMLLLKQGYELVGLTFRSYDSISQACFEKEKGCCNINSIFEAKYMCEKLGFEHYILDIRKEFRETIISNFIEEYLNGRTPNPCVLCNSHIKWGYLLDFADKHDCNWIATGHYARIKKANNRYFLQKGIDKNKDQSYFLWTLTQENLSRTLFPLGSLTKPEVRNIAHENGYEKLSEKKESQEICFVPNNDYRQFLKENVENYNKKSPPGNVLDIHGNIVGTHQGIANYTIGQRKGLHISFGIPKYICAIDAVQNTITIGDKEDLLSEKLSILNFNLQKYPSLPHSFNGEIKIRYSDNGHKARIEQHESHLEAYFTDSVVSVTPGQSAVIYEEDDLVAGGFIQ